MNEGRRRPASWLRAITDRKWANVLYSPRTGIQTEVNIVGVIHDWCENDTKYPMHCWKLDAFLQSVADS